MCVYKENIHEILQLCSKLDIPEGVDTCKKLLNMRLASMFDDTEVEYNSGVDGIGCGLSTKQKRRGKSGNQGVVYLDLSKDVIQESSAVEIGAEEVEKVNKIIDVETTMDEDAGRLEIDDYDGSGNSDGEPGLNENTRNKVQNPKLNHAQNHTQNHAQDHAQNNAQNNDQHNDRNHDQNQALDQENGESRVKSTEIITSVHENSSHDIHNETMNISRETNVLNTVNYDFQRIPQTQIQHIHQIPQFSQMHPSPHVQQIQNLSQIQQISQQNHILQQGTHISQASSSSLAIDSSKHNNTSLLHNSHNILLQNTNNSNASQNTLNSISGQPMSQHAIYQKPQQQQLAVTTATLTSDPMWNPIPSSNFNTISGTYTMSGNLVTNISPTQNSLQGVLLKCQI